MRSEPYKELAETIEVNGHKLPVKVLIYVKEDDTDPNGDFDFGNTEENAVYLKRFTSGELFMASILVKASAMGESGRDSIGACHIHANNYFNSTPFTTDVDQTLAEYDMVNNALNELRSMIMFRIEQFSKLATQVGAQ